MEELVVLRVAFLWTLIIAGGHARECGERGRGSVHHIFGATDVLVLGGAGRQVSRVKVWQ